MIKIILQITLLSFLISSLPNDVRWVRESREYKALCENIFNSAYSEIITNIKILKPEIISSGSRSFKLLSVTSLTAKPVLISTWGLLNNDRYTKKQNNRVIKSANVNNHFASINLVFFSPNMFSYYTIHFLILRVHANCQKLIL